jgi:hypothetical protein
MTTMSDDDTTIDPHAERDDFDMRCEVVLDPDDEHASPDWYPRLGNISAAFIYCAVIRPDTPTRPEYVTMPMDIGGRSRDEGAARIVAVARWNMLWEAAQFRRRFFDEDEDSKPPQMAKIADQGDINVVFVPRTDTRYYEYAPLFHLLPRATLQRFGLPMLRAGQWPVTEVMEDEMRTWATVDNGIDSGQPIPLSDGSFLEGATVGNPRKGSDIWTGEDEAAEFVERIVGAADHDGRLRGILDAVRAHRVEDDFSDRWTYAKEDFERKLRRKRSKVKVTFVELPDTVPVQGPETEIVDRIVFSDFLTLLNPRDREVVVLLRNGTTKLTEIADIMGYRNHSPVSKRLARVRDMAARFFDDN